MPLKRFDSTHANNCCREHGCKYDDIYCPVVEEIISQKYPCEACSEEVEIAFLLPTLHKQYIDDFPY